MISITNWATYQQSEEGAQHAEDHAPQHSESDFATRGTTQQTTHGATLSKEDKNLDKKYMSNSGELDSIPGELDSIPGDLTSKAKPPRKVQQIDSELRAWFDNEFWVIYPRREGKQAALKAAAEKAMTPEKRAFYLERLKAQLPSYHQRKAESGQGVIPMASTWFNQDRADDELDVPQGLRQRAAQHDDYAECVPLSRSAR